MKLSVKNSPPEDIEDVKSAIAESLAPPATLEVRIIKQANNPRFVYADLHGERISVEVPRNTRRTIVGKTVTVATGANESGETTYTLVP